MIYITVGNHYQPFDRLLREADKLASESDEAFIAQTGHCTYSPRHMQSFRFTGRDEALGYMKSARVVISHAGIGTILDAKKCGTPLILVPRRKEFREHNNDHQLEIAAELGARARPGIFIVDPVSGLKDALERFPGQTERGIPGDFSGREKIVSLIRGYLELVSRESSGYIK